MWVRVAITFFLLVLPTALHAQVEKRIALLIGNRVYDASVGVLKNPHNDIAAVGEALPNRALRRRSGPQVSGAGIQKGPKLRSETSR